MITDVSSKTDTTAAAAAMKKSLGLDKDDFMKLFIAQLQYQDPLKPQDPTAMLDQLSQLSLVEQSYNSTTALNKLLTAQNNSLSMTSVGFIGKDVKANGNAASFDGSNPASLQYNLSVPATEATVSIYDAAGDLVKTAAIGAQTAGDKTFAWDGRDTNGALLPAGAYTFKVNATAANGTALTATTYTTGRIDGLNMSGGSPVLMIGSVSVALADVLSVKGA